MHTVLQSVAMLVAVRALDATHGELAQGLCIGGTHGLSTTTGNPGFLCFGMSVVVLLPFAKAGFRIDELLEGSRALFCVMIMLSAIFIFWTIGMQPRKTTGNMQGSPSATYSPEVSTPGVLSQANEILQTPQSQNP